MRTHDAPPSSFWWENMLAVVIQLRVLAKVFLWRIRNNLTNVRSFIILRSEEGLTSFSKTNRVNFLVEQSKMPNEAFWGVKNRKSDLVLFLEYKGVIKCISYMSSLRVASLPPHKQTLHKVSYSNHWTFWNVIKIVRILQLVPGLSRENCLNKITMTSCLISDDKLTIILAVVIPIAVLAVVAGVVAFFMWKKKKDKG